MAVGLAYRVRSGAGSRAAFPVARKHSPWGMSHEGLARDVHCRWRAFPPGNDPSRAIARQKNRRRVIPHGSDPFPGGNGWFPARADQINGECLTKSPADSFPEPTTYSPWGMWAGKGGILIEVAFRHQEGEGVALTLNGPTLWVGIKGNDPRERSISW